MTVDPGAHFISRRRHNNISKKNLWEVMLLKNPGKHELRQLFFLHVTASKQTNLTKPNPTKQNNKYTNKPSTKMRNKNKNKTKKQKHNPKKNKQNKKKTNRFHPPGALVRTFSIVASAVAGGQ